MCVCGEMAPELKPHTRAYTSSTHHHHPEIHTNNTPPPPEWLKTISLPPHNVNLGDFLAMSGSLVRGETHAQVKLDWHTERGQEELVHKAVRVVYPKVRPNLSHYRRTPLRLRHPLRASTNTASVTKI